MLFARVLSIYRSLWGQFHKVGRRAQSVPPNFLEAFCSVKNGRRQRAQRDRAISMKKCPTLFLYEIDPWFGMAPFLNKSPYSLMKVFLPEISLTKDFRHYSEVRNYCTLSVFETTNSISDLGFLLMFPINFFIAPRRFFCNL